MLTSYNTSYIFNFKFFAYFFKKYSPTTPPLQSHYLMFSKLQRIFYIIQNNYFLSNATPRLKKFHSHGLARIDLMSGTLILHLTKKYERMIEVDRE